MKTKTENNQEEIQEDTKGVKYIDTSKKFTPKTNSHSIRDYPVKDVSNLCDTLKSYEEIFKILHKDISLEFPDLKLDFTGNGYNYSMSDVKKAIALKDEACDEDIDNAFIRGQKAERKRTLEIIDKKISDFRSNPAIATYMVPHLEELKKEVLEK